MERVYTFTVCDMCQPSDHAPASFDCRGVMFGKLEDALADGWMETDYGVVCPECVAENDLAAAEEEDGTVVAKAGTEFVFALAELEEALTPKEDEEG